jgi:glycosyltransferase involved in cell wall biosynthesis
MRSGPLLSEAVSVESERLLQPVPASDAATSTDPPLRIVALHSTYRIRGGEDECHDTDLALLAALGHRVVEFRRQASDLARAWPARRAARVVWNGDAAAALTRLVREFRPEVAYVGSSFSALSASCLDVLGRLRVPIVLAIRNYRLACASGVLFRDGAECRICVGRRVPVAAVRHGCYRGQGASVVAVTAMLAQRETLARHADRVWYLPESRHVAEFLRQVGVAADRITVKPTTLRNVPTPTWSAGDHVLLAGRLEPEKGLAEAVEAVRATPGLRLIVVGAGSELDRLLAQGRLADLAGRVEVLGHRSQPEVLRLMAGARATLAPSLWAEPSGRVALESLACGTPIVVGDRGGMREIPEHARSGLIVNPADPVALAGALARVQRDEWWRTGARVAARARFEAGYSPAAVGARLVAVLRAAAAASRPGPRAY